jgi:AcrR family transcriptional regulator
MGRIAGVTAEETRQRLLDTAADVFARLGYEGASIAEISSEAGLSSGAIYAHYAGKAELFVATLRAHGEREFERILGSGSTIDFASFLTARGEALDHRTAAEQTLLIEAVVAAKRDPEVASVLTTSLLDRERQLAALLRATQAIGEIDADLSAEAVVRFTLMVALGSMVVAALDLPPTNRRLVDNVRATPSPEGTP